MTLAITFHQERRSLQRRFKKQSYFVKPQLDGIDSIPHFAVDMDDA